MPNWWTDFVVKLLDGLKAVPLWLLSGVGIALALILFLPIRSLIQFRVLWQGQFWAAFITVSALLVCQITNIFVTANIKRRQLFKERQSLRITPGDAQRFHCHSAVQQDGTFLLQFSGLFDVIGTSDTVRILRVDVVKPKFGPSVRLSSLEFIADWFPYDRDVAAPHAMRTLIFHTAVRSRSAWQDGASAHLRIIDANEGKYKFKIRFSAA